MSAERATYLDSSAIVKLVVREAETAALRRHLRRRRPLVSSAIARAEVSRALLPIGERALRAGRHVLGRIELVAVNRRVLAAAGVLEPPNVRTLDAIHLATAALLGESLGSIVTYDKRLSDAASAQGWTVAAPV